MKEINDLISRKRILYELGESTMPKRYRDFCIRVINDTNLTPIAPSPSEDLRDWIIDYWFCVEEEINSAISTYLEDDLEFNFKDPIDRDNLGEFVSEKIKKGILNVIETYEVEE